MKTLHLIFQVKDHLPFRALKTMIKNKIKEENSHYKNIKSRRQKELAQRRMIINKYHRSKNQLIRKEKRIVP